MNNFWLTEKKDRWIDLNDVKSSKLIDLYAITQELHEQEELMALCEEKSEPEWPDIKPLKINVTITVEGPKPLTPEQKAQLFAPSVNPIPTVEATLKKYEELKLQIMAQNPQVMGIAVDSYDQSWGE